MSYIDLQEEYATNEVMFWGQVGRGSTASISQITITIPIKGCLQTNSSVAIITTDCLSPFQVYETVLVSGSMGISGRTMKPVSCDSVHTVNGVSLADKLWLANRVHPCDISVCLNGKVPLNCRGRNTCPDLGDDCDAATCVPNPCDACRSEYFHESGSLACADKSIGQCPEGSTPNICEPNACQVESISNLRESGCERWADAAACVSSSCHGCHSHWVDNIGRPVCQNISSSSTSCQDLRNIDFGACDTNLGYGVLYQKCQLIIGCRDAARGLSLYQTQGSCEKACRCGNLDLVDYGKCGQKLGYVFSQGGCDMVYGCASDVASISMSLFSDSLMCLSVCLSSEEPELQPVVEVQSVLTTITLPTMTRGDFNRTDDTRSINLCGKTAIRLVKVGCGVPLKLPFPAKLENASQECCDRFLPFYVNCVENAQGKNVDLILYLHNFNYQSI